MLRPPRPAERPPTVEIMRKLGMEPDPWQVEVLNSDDSQLLLNCCRQAGKSTVVALLGLVEAMFRPMTRVVLVSRSHRQSRELLRTIVFFYRLLGERVKARINSEEMTLVNLSRIVCVPCREDTIRGLAHVDLLIIDEAARVPDDLYRAVRPMLAALRYLISRLDAGRMGRRRMEEGAAVASKPLSAEEIANRKFWAEFEGDEYWIPLN
jgi:hypothetical protein